MKQFTPSVSVSVANITTNVAPDFIFKGPGVYRIEIVEATRVSTIEYVGDVRTVNVMEVADITDAYLTANEDATLFASDCWSREESDHYSMGIPYGIEHRYYLVV